MSSKTAKENVGVGSCFMQVVHARGGELEGSELGRQPGRPRPDRAIRIDKKCCKNKNKGYMSRSVEESAARCLSNAVCVRVEVCYGLDLAAHAPTWAACTGLTAPGTGAAAATTTAGSATTPSPLTTACGQSLIMWPASPQR